MKNHKWDTSKYVKLPFKDPRIEKIKELKLKLEVARNALKKVKSEYDKRHLTSGYWDLLMKVVNKALKETK